MACPFFMPTEPMDGGPWPHPARLPLGRGWSGICSAGETLVRPTEEELSKHCNLGYARCGRLPEHRAADAIRFCVAAVGESAITISFVSERCHLPVEHGRLQFDRSGTCAQPHSDQRIQRLVACFVASYLERNRSGASNPCGDSGPQLFDSLTENP